MRVFVISLVVALSLVTHGIEGNLSLSLSSSPTDTYKSFIQQVRKALTVGSYQWLYDIPVLQNQVPNSERFYFVKLSSEKDETITLAIDVMDVGLVAYRAGKESYFFPNAPSVAFHILFTTTNRHMLNFNNTYQSIENAAGTTRLETPLGVVPADSAISNLFQYRRELVPVSFLVIMQMFLEAAKFKFIEQRVINSIQDENNFTPSLAMVSLENNWSELSLQIQASMSLQGLFGKSIELYNSNDEPIEVDSIYYPIVVANVALQLYHCQVRIRDGKMPQPNFIRMPGIGRDTNDNDPCYVQQRTMRISGREGFCAAVASGLVSDGSRLILSPCGEQDNQKWTFQSDGTVRSLGKCLATKTSRFGNSVVVYNCDKANPDNINWEVFMTGTIMNPSSNLVLTANAATKSTSLTVEANAHAASQGWRVGNYVKPIIASIMGLKQMCLEATDGNTNMWLENCVKSKKEQYWALYGDGTIRVNNDHSLCVTSPIDNSSKVITILSCNGSPNQRWFFRADGTISNLATGKRMDVAQSDVSLKKIILNPSTGYPNQQWVIFY